MAEIIDDKIITAKALQDSACFDTSKATIGGIMGREYFNSVTLAFLKCHELSSIDKKLGKKKQT